MPDLFDASPSPDPAPAPAARPLADRIRPASLGDVIGQDAVRPADEGVSAKAFFYMPIRITLPVNLIDPTEKVE